MTGAHTLVPLGALEHLGSGFDDVLDHPVGGKGRQALRAWRSS